MVKNRNAWQTYAEETAKSSLIDGIFIGACLGAGALCFILTITGVIS